MEALIRKAAEEDLESINRLYAQPDMDDGDVLSIGQLREVFRKIASYPDYNVYIAEQDGEIVGTYALLIMHNMAHGGQVSGVVEDVVVKTGMQGKGIGRLMMHHAMEQCRNARCYKMALSSNISREKAHAFYESLGFKKHGYSFLVEF